MHDTLQRLFRYKAWANDELLTALAGLGGESPITGLAIKALSHSYVVDRIFAAHMRRKAHAYTSANLSEMPTLEDLSADIRKFGSTSITCRRSIATNWRNGSTSRSRTEIRAACHARRCSCM